MSKETNQLMRAQYEVEKAKQRLASTLGTLQYRLRPGTLMNNAWEGVRGKSSDIADDAMQAVKGKPLTASGIVAAIVIFLARDPLMSVLSKLFSKREEKDPGAVTTKLNTEDSNYDLTAPEAGRLVDEGVTS